jgi:hypothetical protein
MPPLKHARALAGEPRVRGVGLVVRECHQIALRRARWSTRGDGLDELPDCLLRKVTGKISFADYADHPMVVDYRQAADLVFLHQLQDLGDIRCRAYRDGFGPGQLANGHRARVDAPCYAFDDDVAVGDDAEQTAILAADRKRPDIEIPHLRCRVLQRLTLAGALRSGVHDVPRSFHCDAPQFGLVCTRAAPGC